MQMSDLTILQSVAVHREDIVRAYEMRVRKQEKAVLRVTPPFSAKMRGRIHIETDDDDYMAGDSENPIHISPRSLLDDPPVFPTPDDTADQLRADPNVEYTRERHHRVHEERVKEWRETIARSITNQATIALAEGEKQQVDIVALGSWPPNNTSER